MLAEWFLLLLELFFLFFGSEQSNSSVFFFLYRHTHALHDGREEGRKEGSEGNGKALSPQRFSLRSSKIWFCSLMPQNGLQDFLPWVNPSNKHGLQDFISLG